MIRVCIKYGYDKRRHAILQRPNDTFNMNYSKASAMLEQLKFPPDFFDPPNPRPVDWPDNPQLRRAVEWFKSFMPPQQWIERREKAARRLYAGALGVTVGDGRYFDSKDGFGWYLFLAEAMLDHIGNYDYLYGSRVVPIILAIGRDLDLLKAVEGVESRVDRMVGIERGQPNGGLFELLVASCYARAGAKVAFVEERPGQAQTYDMDVTLNGRTWAVECKRMEVGAYSESERLQIGRLWSPCSKKLGVLEQNTLCKVRFKIELKKVPDNYLMTKVTAWLESGFRDIEWSDSTSDGSVSVLDLRPLRQVLATDMVMGSSHRITELLTGSYVRNSQYQTMLRIKRGDNPRYVDDCDLAIVLHWESLSDASISSKARDIRKKLSEATAQLPTGRPSIIHVGFEAVEGDRVERLRHSKILATARRFDPGEKQLEYVYCHYFVPESPPDESWAFDETTQWCGIRHSQPKPLEKCFLVLSQDSRTRSGPHWQA